MRLGCGGCLGVLVLLGVSTVALGTGIWIGTRLTEPPVSRGDQGDATAARLAQQRMAELVRPGRGPRSPVEVSERELNAFLARNVVPGPDFPLRDLSVVLVGEGIVELSAAVPAGDLLLDSRPAGLSPWLPRAALDYPVWVTVRAGVRVEAPPASRRRYLRLDVERFTIGRQRLPLALFRLLPSPALLGLLRWRLPESIEGLGVEPGRLRVIPAGSPSRSAAADRKESPRGPGSPREGGGPRSARAGG
jgi:hypothetical protein